MYVMMCESGICVPSSAFLTNNKGDHELAHSGDPGEEVKDDERDVVRSKRTTDTRAQLDEQGDQKSLLPANPETNNTRS